MKEKDFARLVNNVISLSICLSTYLFISLALYLLFFNFYLICIRKYKVNLHAVSFNWESSIFFYVLWHRLSEQDPKTRGYSFIRVDDTLLQELHASACYEMCSHVSAAVLQ